MRTLPTTMDYTTVNIHELADCLVDDKISPECAEEIRVPRSYTRYRVHPGVAIRSHKITGTLFGRFNTTLLTPPGSLVIINYSNEPTNDTILSERVYTESHVRRHSWFPHTWLPSTTYPILYTNTNVQYTVGEYSENESIHGFKYPYGLYSVTRDSEWMKE